MSLWPRKSHEADFPGYARQHRAEQAAPQAAQRSAGRAGARRLLIDCGEDWRDSLQVIAPDAILITHAHPDHAWGLAQGAPCPVLATESSWTALPGWPIADRRILAARVRYVVHGLRIEAFGLVHSLRTPAVGYRVTAGGATFFYAPDVVDIVERKAALGDLTLYIGDGSSITRSLVRWRDGERFGHTTIGVQLDWCAEARVPQAIFTHCSSEILKGDERRLGATVRRLGRARGLAARLAYDGLTMPLSAGRLSRNCLAGRVIGSALRGTDVRARYRQVEGR